jgi:hypothetical protein
LALKIRQHLVPPPSPPTSTGSSSNASCAVTHSLCDPLYVVLVFGVMYLLFTTFTSVFEGQYGCSTSNSGLTYLRLGVALVISMVLFNFLNGHVQAARMKADGVQQPRHECRLFLMIWFRPFVAGGLFSMVERHTTKSIGLFPFLAQA